MKIIVVLDLGGTISKYTPQESAEFYNHRGDSISSFIDGYLFAEKVKIAYEYFCDKISHELSMNEILALGNKVQDIIDKPEVFGLVISMGTNVLEDIAYFISLVIHTKKTIVFTGAHFPQNSLCFDGRKNLYNALILAKTEYTHEIGVVVTFNDTVVSARWATKSMPGIPNDFSFGGMGIIGYVVGEIFHQKMIPLHKQTHKSEFSIRNIDFFPKILILYAHLGLGVDLTSIIDIASFDGIISAGYGKGYQTQVISELLCKASSANIPIVRCARSGQAISNNDENYDNKYGFIFTSDISPQKASILLSVCLSQKLSTPIIQRVFQEY